MLKASIPLLQNLIRMNDLLLSRKDSNLAGSKRRKRATSHIMLTSMHYVENVFPWESHVKGITFLAFFEINRQ